MKDSDSRTLHDSDSRTLAVLIDADNTSPKIAPGLFGEIIKYGTIGVARIYADWTIPASRGWKECLALYAIQPVQQFAYRAGKNAADNAMIIDAMDLLHTERFSGFCLVSSDSDFARLAIRIRQQGVRVFGFGERHTPQAFVNACDRFVHLDTLRVPAGQRLDRAGLSIAKLVTSRTLTATHREDSERNLPPVPARLEHAPGRLDDAVLLELEEALLAVADKEGRATLASLGNQILKQMPGFDSRKYGFAKLSDLADACDFLEVERVGEIMQSITVRWIPLHSDAPPPPKARQ